MILVFGGTTEGLKTVKTLEEAGNAYYYSTRGCEQQVTLRHGTRLCGTMDGGTMLRFCHDNGIRLLIDAAHPFAAQLHDTVAATAQSLGIPAIRFERIYPMRDTGHAEWCDSYEEAVGLLGSCRCVLATTGVQSISRLAPLKARGIKMYYRILYRRSSLELARKQGAEDDELCFYSEERQEGDVPADGTVESNVRLFARLRPDAVLMKESGLTGGFVEKVEAARRMGIRAVVIRRPATPEVFHCVDGEHGLRRMVERLLPDFYPLHSGLTTGTCATAAAVAAAMRTLRNETPPTVPVILPDGETIRVDVTYGDGYAAVIKDSGDDPDVTDGVEIRAEIRFGQSPAAPERESECPQKAGARDVMSHSSSSSGEADEAPKDCVFRILAGEGIGTITLPGFDYPPGTPAINKVPRRMITENLAGIVSTYNDGRKVVGSGRECCVTISVPGGEELARRTFNPRLGIVGGISIVGVSGIIKPFSEESFVASIRKCMKVAKAGQPERIVINSGAKSERYVKAAYPGLPPQAFVEYGNFIGETIRIAAELGIKRLTLGVMIGKAVKLAAGNLDTHSRRATMDKDFVASMVAEAGCDETIRERARGITLARELWTIVPPEIIDRFCQVVIARCLTHCRPLLPGGELTILLVDEEGGIHK